MSKIIIDGKEYDTEQISDEAKAQLASVQFVDTELAHLQAQAAALQTARVAYANELKKHLNPMMPDVLKFN